MRYTRTIAGFDITIEDLGAKIMVSARTKFFMKSLSIALDDAEWVFNTLREILGK